MKPDQLLRRIERIRGDRVGRLACLDAGFGRPRDGARGESCGKRLQKEATRATRTGRRHALKV
jgi:hypothetical protein